MSTLIPPGLRIPKSRIVVSKLIDHVLYDPFGIGGQKFLLEHVVIGSDLQSLYVQKSVQDSFTQLDEIVLRYLAGRVITDSVTLTDTITAQFVTAVLRQIADSIFFESERPSFIQIPGAIADVVSMLDSELRFIRLRDNYEFDSIDVAEELTRTFAAYRTFADSVGMIDNFTLIDGSTYTLDKGIREFISVGLDTPERVSGSAAENISFMATKLLLDVQDQTDLIAKILEKTATTDTTEFADATAFFEGKNITSDFELVSEIEKFDLGKELSDQTLGLEQLAFDFLKSLADTTTMLDNLDLGDQLEYDALKELADAFDLADADSIWADKVQFDAFDLQDIIAADIGKVLTSDILLESKTNFAVQKTADTDVAEPIERIFKLSGLFYNHGTTLSDVLNTYFVRNKTFFDTVGAADAEFLLDDEGDITQLLDGINKFNITIGKYDAAEASEYFARAVRFHLYPWQGFRHSVTESDQTITQLGYGMTVSVPQNIPLLRVNKIYYSEQMGATYWEKTNVSTDSDAGDIPPLRYPDPTVLYDPSYDAANIAEIFEGYQYRNPAGRAWYREAKLLRQTQPVSQADLIIEDAVTGQHYFEAEIEADFPDLDRFAFGIHLKKANRRYVKLTAAGNYFAIFDLDVGAVVSTNADSAEVGGIGDGWFFCQLSARLPVFLINDPEEQFALDILLNSPDNPRAIRRFDLLASSRDKTIRIQSLDDNLNSVYLGTGTGSFYAWGAHLEVGDQVELEKTGLNYVRTVGGQESKVGFNIMPRDQDRVWVGSLFRDRSVYPNRIFNDPYEHLEYLLAKNTIDDVLIEERNFKDFAKSIKKDQTTEFSGTTVLAGTDSEVVFIGQQNGGVYYAGDVLESRDVSLNKVAKRGFNTDPQTQIPWNRTNLLEYSEDFRNPYWTKVRTISFRSDLLTSGNLPYRSTEHDANQVHELLQFQPKTYYGNRWYEIVPLSDLPDYTSNVVCDVFEQPLFGEHLIQTTVFDDIPARNVFSYSVYASPVGGVDRFRLQVNNNVFADFDLSSVSVVSSNSVFYSEIQTIDTSNMVYLCRIIGPADRIRETFSSQDFLHGVVVGTSDTIRLKSAAQRIFQDSLTQADQFILGEVVDYQTGTGNEDYQTDTSGINLDFQVSPSEY